MLSALHDDSVTAAETFMTACKALYAKHLRVLLQARLDATYASRMKLNREETQAVLRALSVLPQDHPARAAFDKGADPVVLVQYLEREELIENLNEIWLAAYRRRLARRGGGRPSA
jgi:hypothetical protein